MRKKSWIILWKWTKRKTNELEITEGDGKNIESGKELGEGGAIRWVMDSVVANGASPTCWKELIIDLFILDNIRRRKFEVSFNVICCNFAQVFFECFVNSSII